MDLLFKRYASPFLFIDGMIQTGRFTEFVENLIDISNKEKEDKSLWEYYLSVRMQFYEGTFNDFRKGVETDKKNAALSVDDIETTIQNSMNILQNFNPEKKG